MEDGLEDVVVLLDQMFEALLHSDRGFKESILFTIQFQLLIIIAEKDANADQI